MCKKLSEKYSDFKDVNGVAGEILKKIFVNRRNPGVNRRAAAPGRAYFNKILDIAKHQYMALGVFLFLMLSVNFYLKQFELLHAHRGSHRQKNQIVNNCNCNYDDCQGNYKLINHL